VNIIKTTNLWRIVTAYPLLYLILSSICAYFWIPYDSPKNALSKRDFEEAKKSIEMIYDSEENTEEIMKFLSTNIQEDTNTVTIKDALCNP
jgi:hypothetical protein